LFVFIHVVGVGMIKITCLEKLDKVNVSYYIMSFKSMIFLMSSQRHFKFIFNFFYFHRFFPRISTVC